MRSMRRLISLCVASYPLSLVNHTQSDLPPWIIIDLHPPPLALMSFRPEALTHPKYHLPKLILTWNTYI